MNIYRKPIFFILFSLGVVFVFALTLLLLFVDYLHELEMQRLITPAMEKINYSEALSRTVSYGKYFLPGAAIYILLGGGFLYFLWKNRQAESKLRQSQWLASFADGIEEGFYAFDRQFNITFWNRGIEEISGKTSQEVLGKNLFKLFPFLKDPKLGAPLHAALEGKSSIQKEARLPFEGRELLVNRHFFPIYDSERKTVMGGFALIYDLRRAKTMEETLQKYETETAQLQQQLQQAQKMESLGQLAGGMAHDFNNILTVIIGYADAASLNLKNPEKAQIYLEKIPEQSKRAAQLIARLLLFARHAEIEQHPLDLVSFTKEMVYLLRRTLPENIQIETRFEPHTPLIQADLTQIQQVILNLATNARDAMPQGGTLTLSAAPLEIDKPFAQLHAEAKPGPYVVFSIRDTGCGMTPEVKKHLFEPFFTTKTKEKGTGLGLSMVYGIIKQHGGFIDVYSEEGKGTEFKIYLPAIGVKAKEAVAEEISLLPRGTEKILIVEDDLQVRDAVELMLRRQGYQVALASNGKEALETFRKASPRFDLVISDMVMPKMGGAQLFSQLKKEFPEVRFLLISGYGMEEEIKNLKQNGVLGFLHKPFLLSTFAREVRQALDRPLPPRNQVA